LLDLVLLDSQSCSGGFGILKLTLLKLEVTLHLVDLSTGGQLVLPSHSLLHVLKELCNHLLLLLDLLLVLRLFLLKLLCEGIDLLFLLVENFVLLFLLLSSSSLIFLKVLINFFDILMISFDHFLDFSKFFLHLFDFGVVLLHSILESFSGLRERKIQLVGLELKVFLFLQEVSSLFLKMLCSLFEGILS
jgi:hypothetical protein